MMRYPAILLATLVSLLLLAFSTQARAYMEDNLLLRYDFNKGRGAIVSDQTGLGYQANLQGDTIFIDNDPWAETTGMAKFGNAILFDGAGDYLNIDSNFHNTRLNMGKLALAAWVRPAAAGAGKQYLVSKLNHAAKTGYALTINNKTGFLSAEIYINGAETLRKVNSATRLPNNIWTHIAVSFDGNSIQLYLNGVPSNSIIVNGRIRASSEEFTIGALSGASPSNWFSGAIDELRLYSALSAADISMLAAAENGEPELILYESFDTVNRIWADKIITGAYFTGLDSTDLVEGRFDNALHFQDNRQENEMLHCPR